MTISSALRRQPNPESQDNGAMMRVCPLGIFWANHRLERVANWAAKDAELIHPNRVCMETNALFAMAIALAVNDDGNGRALYGEIREWALGMNGCRAVMETVERAGEAPPEDFVRQLGWILIAYQNALYPMVHADAWNLRWLIRCAWWRYGYERSDLRVCGVEGIPVQ
jgi:hypothetical protein